jgi:4-carboxymuconolactone decarboxylase
VESTLKTSATVGGVEVPDVPTGLFIGGSWRDAAEGGTFDVGQRKAEMADEAYERGLEIREEMLGSEHGRSKVEGADDFTRDFEELVTRYCFGSVWDREQLPRDTRSLLTLAMLVAMGRAHAIRIHVKGAIANGVTREQIRELMIHAMPYCGIPPALDGLRHAGAVLDELGVA